MTLIMEAQELRATLSKLAPDVLAAHSEQVTTLHANRYIIADGM